MLGVLPRSQGSKIEFSINKAGFEKKFKFLLKKFSSKDVAFLILMSTENYSD